MRQGHSSNTSNLVKQDYPTEAGDSTLPLIAIIASKKMCLIPSRLTLLP